MAQCWHSFSPREAARAQRLFGSQGDSDSGFTPTCRWAWSSSLTQRICSYVKQSVLVLLGQVLVVQRGAS